MFELGGVEEPVQLACRRETGYGYPWPLTCAPVARHAADMRGSTRAAVCEQQRVFCTHGRVLTDYLLTLLLLHVRSCAAYTT